MPKIKYLLFDCDNTLVQTEHLAFQGCANLANEILEKKGISHRYSGPSMQRSFVGLNFRALLSRLSSIHGFTLTPSEIDTYASRELSTIIQMIKSSAEPCVNANPVLSQLVQEKKYGLSVVSSSALSRVQASLAKAGQAQFFDEDKVYSAATSLPSGPSSKPDPAVYLFACEQLKVRPEECLAVEDSKSGATAAMRAGIHLLGYTGAYDTEEEMGEMDKVLREECEALEVMRDWKDFPEILERIEAM